MSIHVPRFVIEPQHSFQNLSWIQSCSRSFCLGFVHETANVIDLVISEATRSQHQLSRRLRMPCSLLQRSLAGVCPGRRAIASYRRFARSRLSRAPFLYPFLSRNTKISLYPSGFARSGMCNSRLAKALGIPPSRRTNRGRISFYHRPWIQQPRLRPQKCSLPDSRRANR